jgi:endonuclease/exonuclease/phosphatase family metal-dependent hydrolase
MRFGSAGAVALVVLLTAALTSCAAGSGQRPTAGKEVSPPSATISAAPTTSARPEQRVAPAGPALSPKAAPQKHQHHKKHARAHGKRTHAKKHHKRHAGPSIPLVSDPFTVATFNTLGAAHTARGGNKPGMPGASVRTLRMISILRRHQVDVVGLQEFETPQANLFHRRAGEYAYWHPSGKSANAIAWRKDRFALVDATSQPVHYFGGQIQPMPVVLLRDLRNPSFEFWVLNVHNPASTRWHPGNQRWRMIDMVKEHALAQRLIATTGHPVLFTGDMNEKSSAFCAFTRDGVLRAAQGGSHEGGQCRPPALKKIDWIFGSQHVMFSDFRVDRSALVRKTTDHSVVLTEAQLLSSGS